MAFSIIDTAPSTKSGRAGSLLISLLFFFCFVWPLFALCQYTRNHTHMTLSVCVCVRFWGALDNKIQFLQWQRTKDNKSCNWQQILCFCQLTKWMFKIHTNTIWTMNFCYIRKSKNVCVCVCVFRNKKLLNNLQVNKEF